MFRQSSKVTSNVKGYVKYQKLRQTTNVMSNVTLTHDV